MTCSIGNHLPMSQCADCPDKDNCPLNGLPPLTLEELMEDEMSEDDLEENTTGGRWK